MKRIVIDARESGTSTGRYIDKLVEYLHKLEPEFEILVLAKTHRLNYLKKIAPNFKIVESIFKEFTFSEQLGLRKQLKQLNGDLVHFGMTQQPVLYRGKVITTIHDLTTTRFRNPSKNPLLFGIKQLVYKAVIQIVARKSAGVIVPSQFVKKDVAQYTKIDSSKITVTYEAADRISEYPKPVDSLAGKKFLLYVGRPLPHKNLKRLIEAYSIIRNTRDGVRLVLVGRKDILYEKLAKWADAEHIEGLFFTGFVSEAQLRWLYENCSAYVFPSLSEGFGLPGLEAMAHGAPVAASRSSSLPEIYGPAAVYFNPENIRDMVKVIGDLLGSPTKAQRMKILGAKQVQKYSWQKMAEQTLDVYGKTLNT